MRGQGSGKSRTVLNAAFTPFTVLLGGFLIDATGARPIYLVTGIVVLLSGVGLLLVKERQARACRLICVSNGSLANIGSTL